MEPWSEYLTGRMGQAPQPAWDPLAYAVDEAHRRGLELHAWFNPFRARHMSAQSAAAATHVTRTHPEWVKTYGRLLWLDPGEAAVQDYSLQVILDVVRRYDVDGVHLDDYFYPYRMRDAEGQPMSFDDTVSWKRYQGSAGKLDRDNWRRQNIDRFIERLYSAVKAEKLHVKVGISPFGIWRPGFPKQIQGHDAYAYLYADSRKWLQNGWLDYLAPQLYWDIEPPAQSYPVLLKWWTEQNPKKRLIFPGNDISRIGRRNRSVQEIVSQIQLTRQSSANGNILWNFKPLLQNRDGLNDALKQQLYTSLALAPAIPGTAAPKAPLLQGNARSEARIDATWSPRTNEVMRWWVLRAKRAIGWDIQIMDGRRTSATFEGAPDVVAIAGVDRAGNIGAWAALEKAATVASKSEPPAKPRPKPRQIYLPPKLRS